MKRISSIILTIVFSICSFGTLAAEDTESIGQLAYDFSEGFGSDWSSYASNAEVRSENGYVALDADTMSEAAKAEAKACSPKLDSSSKDKLLLTFDFQVDSSDVTRLNKYFYVVWSGDGTEASSKARLVWIQDNAVRIGASTTAYEQTDFFDTRHTMLLALDIGKCEVSAWIDNKLLAENVAFSATGIDKSKLQFMFSNTYSDKMTESVLRLYNFYVTNAQHVEITSEPSDKFELVDISKVGRLEVNFGTMLKSCGGVTLYKADADSENYEVTSEEFTFSGFIATAKLLHPLEPFKKYKISVTDAEGFYGDRVQKTDLVFSTAPAGYVAPEVAITSLTNGDVCRGNSDITITAEARSESADIVKVDFFANDNLVASDTSYPFSCSMTVLEEEVKYDFYSVAYDSMGGKTKSEAVTVTILQNDPPTVRILGELDGQTLTPEELSQIEVSATDNNKVAYVELLSDNQVVGRKTEAPYIFSMADCKLGTHVLKAVAYDNDGKSAEDSVKIYVLLSYDSQLDNVICFYDKKGYVKGRDNSGDICVGENLTLEFSTKDGILSGKSDISFSDLSVRGTIMVRGMASDGVTRVDMYNIVEFKDGVVNVLGTNVGGYEAGKIYSLLFSVDAKNKSFKFSLDEKESGNTVAQSQQGVPNTNFDSLALIRINCTEANGIDDRITCSDVRVGLIGDYPYITSVRDNFGSTSVSFNATSVICTLSSEIGELSMGDVKLENELGDVALESIEKLSGSEVVVTPKNGFESACTYTVTFGEKLELIGGEVSGREIVGHFNVAPKCIDVSSGNFTAVDDIFFTAKLVNLLEKKSVVVVMITYENGIIKDITSKTCDVESGEMVISTPRLPMPENNPSVEAFVLDGWNTRIPISSKIFKYDFLN